MSSDDNVWDDDLADAFRPPEVPQDPSDDLLGRLLERDVRGGESSAMRTVVASNHAGGNETQRSYGQGC